ncbi:DUF6268 family outer membrane beta-barrel protein [Spirosoma flavum]|uniref:DUF6268 family outer membrane beta-barrel protein n=1 Tax=Spirosoma flavum TaxID=2048557 RepID=A0ABW6AS17_9BACT
MKQQRSLLNKPLSITSGYAVVNIMGWARQPITNVGYDSVWRARAIAHQFRLQCWVLQALLVVLPLVGRGQGYTEGVSLNADVLPLSIGGPDHASSFRAFSIRASVIVPFFLKKDKSQALLLGAGGEAVYFDGSRPGFEVKHLYAGAPVLGYTRQITQKLRLTGIFIPTLSADYQQIKGSDVQYGGIVRGVYRVRPTLALRAALGYRQTFYGPIYIVLGGLDWQVSRKVRVFGDLPANLTGAWAATPKVNAGFDMAANFSTYSLSVANEYVRYRTFLAGLFCEYYVRPQLALRATVGYSIIRNLEVYRRNDRVTGGVLDFVNLGHSPTPISPAISNGVVARLTLSFRLPNP